MLSSIWFCQILAMPCSRWLNADWRGGFADILLMDSSKAAFGYSAKYLSKILRYDAADSKATRTLVLFLASSQEIIQRFGQYR